MHSTIKIGNRNRQRCREVEYVRRLLRYYDLMVEAPGLSLLVPLLAPVTLLTRTRVSLGVFHSLRLQAVCREPVIKTTPTSSESENHTNLLSIFCRLSRQNQVRKNPVLDQMLIRPISSVRPKKDLQSHEAGGRPSHCLGSFSSLHAEHFAVSDTAIVTPKVLDKDHASAMYLSQGNQPQATLRYAPPPPMQSTA